MATRGKWLLYGANGYTGRLVAEEAVRRGLQPILAGRNADELEALGQRLHLPVRVFGLDAPTAVRAGLQDVGLVLHCAGPTPPRARPATDGSGARCAAPMAARRARSCGHPTAMPSR